MGNLPQIGCKYIARPKLADDLLDHRARIVAGVFDTPIAIHNTPYRWYIQENDVITILDILPKNRLLKFKLNNMIGWISFDSFLYHDIWDEVSTNFKATEF